MQKITPHLWYDKEAVEAAEFYVSAFGEDSKVLSRTMVHNTPSGDCDIVSFQLGGYKFMSISAGPVFKFNPSISFIVNFDPSRDKNSGKNIDALWEKLSHKGTVLMPIDKYPFSERYGWVQDRYGLSWQLIHTDPKGEERPFIMPSLLFVESVCGKAEEAVNFYISVFKKGAKIGSMHRYGAKMEPDKEGNVMFSDFMLSDQWFAAMDSAREHEFSFNEAVSFMVSCSTQEEIDHYWQSLSAVPESEMCGWLKDKFGVSWQIVPADMDEMMSKGTAEQRDRVTQAFLKMKKFDIAELRKAYEGK